MSDEQNNTDAAPSRPINLEAGRRAFIKAAGLGGAYAAFLGATTGTADAATQDLDVAILNFALNLEYLEAEFYQQAAYGVGLPPNLTTGKQSLGAVVGGRKVQFANPIVADYAVEIANDEKNHVIFLRAALGANAVARPQIDIGNAFTVAAQAAGVVPANGGAAPFITNKQYLAAAAGILSVEAYHAGLIRTFLFAQQSAVANQATALISGLRATLSGAADDQGIGADQSTLDGGFPSPANIVPTDPNSLAFARTPRQVLNVVYGAAGASSGLFFPYGANGGPGGAALLNL